MADIVPWVILGLAWGAGATLWLINQYLDHRGG